MNESPQKIIWILVPAFLLLCSGYLLWKSYDLSNQRGATDPIGEELGRAGTAIESAIDRAQSAEAGLERSEEAINHSQSAIGESEKRIDSIQERAATLDRGFAELTDRFGESKQIVQRIRGARKENK